MLAPRRERGFPSWLEANNLGVIWSSVLNRVPPVSLR